MIYNENNFTSASGHHCSALLHDSNVYSGPVWMLKSLEGMLPHRCDNFYTDKIYCTLCVCKSSCENCFPNEFWGSKFECHTAVYSPVYGKCQWNCTQTHPLYSTRYLWYNRKAGSTELNDNSIVVMMALYTVVSYDHHMFWIREGELSSLK